MSDRNNSRLDKRLDKIFDSMDMGNCCSEETIAQLATVRAIEKQTEAIEAQNKLLDRFVDMYWDKD